MGGESSNRGEGGCRDWGSADVGFRENSTTGRRGLKANMPLSRGVLARQHKKKESHVKGEKGCSKEGEGKGTVVPGYATITTN